MSFPYTPNLRDEKIESLQTQHEYLRLLRLRHLQWLSSAETSEMENAHLKVAELLELVTDRYTQLLRALEQQEAREAGARTSVAPVQPTAGL